ncbi:C-GCAxxG-C-C family (seleno)protein [Marispirochaeta aestuarii]|uniref:C-GCAxxG-C-C family (seleno)protein n=1 Tax=Marispirochaeta aestuarii TaxID=1963862 RepID=UPI0029C9896D|nr:C-GCAxxG-C-C family (seleno)protein [Marispirochaeta aestuarii]
MIRKKESIQDIVNAGLAGRENLNCAETVLFAANQAYQLRLPPEALKLSAAFGGGMGVEKSCGAITGGVMAISTIFVKGRAKVDERFKEINRKLFSRVQDELGSTDCDRLKAMYRDEVIGCHNVIARIGGILEKLIDEELKAP